MNDIRRQLPDGSESAPEIPGTASRPKVGWIEACGWAAGYQLAQLLVVALLATSLIWLASPTFPPSLEHLIRIFDELGWGSSFLFTGVATLACLAVIWPLARWRIGGSVRRAFGMRRLDPAELLLLLAAVLPLGFLSDELYSWAAAWTASLAESLPWLKPAATFDTITLVQRQAASTAFPVLLVALALGPALGEELVFRGVIGTGLKNRWGQRRAIVLTTLLFAAAHGSPAHAIATVPVGLFLHFTFLATGNLWAPILVHGLLNALAVTHLKLDGSAVLETTPTLLFAAAGYLLVIGTLLWHLRPDETGPRRRLVMPTRLFPYVASCSALSYTVVTVWTLMG